MAFPNYIKHKEKCLDLVSISGGNPDMLQWCSNCTCIKNIRQRNIMKLAITCRYHGC